MTCNQPASDNPASRKGSEPAGMVEGSGDVFADLGLPNPGVERRLADARIAGLSMPIVHALAELVSVAIESVGEHEPRLVTALDDAVAAIMGAVLPAEMTPAIADVLRLQIWRTAKAAHVFRAAGADIPRHVEDEQAYVLFRFLHLALQHGENWGAEADAQIIAAREAIAAKLAEAKAAGEGSAP